MYGYNWSFLWKNSLKICLLKCNKSKRDYQSIAITIGTQMCLEDPEKLSKKIFISCLCPKIKSTETDQWIIIFDKT